MRIVSVALEGILMALDKGQQLPLVDGENPFVLEVERRGLLDKLELMQENENQKLSNKAMEIMEKYFAAEDGEDDFLLDPDEGHLRVIEDAVASGADAGVPSYK